MSDHSKLLVCVGDRDEIELSPAFLDVFRRLADAAANESVVLTKKETIGYHGTTEAAARTILASKELRQSNDTAHLGRGAYFYVAGRYDPLAAAQDWARTKNLKPAVISANLDFVNLFDTNNVANKKLLFAFARRAAKEVLANCPSELRHLQPDLRRIVALLAYSAGNAADIEGVFYDGFKAQNADKNLTAGVCVKKSSCICSLSRFDV